MRLLAPAKINLALEIDGRRADGFHELRTLMVPISLCDELELDFADHGLIFSATGCDFPVESNLAFRAAQLFGDRTGRKMGARIDLVKHIPAGAGLGGGSSDAATVLMGLDRLFETKLGDEVLMAMASELGSDCAFFVKRRPLIMGGRGEIMLNEVDVAERAYLLVMPPFSLSTAAVYRALKLPLTRLSVLAKLDANAEVRPEECLINDLELAAYGLSPELETLKQELLDAGALGALMSGSGSCVFGVFSDQDHLHGSMRCLKRREGYTYLPTTRLTEESNGHYRSEGISGSG